MFKLLRSSVAFKKHGESIPGKQISALAKILRCRLWRYVVKFQQMVNFGSLDPKVDILGTFYGQNGCG